VRGLRLLDLERPSLLCVFGGGAVGQLLARLAVQSGHRVAVIDPNQARCDLALAHGAIGACRPEEAAGLCRELTGGEGFDACADTAGAPGVVAAAVDVVKRGGCVALIGADHSPMSLSPLTLIMSEVRLQAVLSHTLDDFVAAVELLVGRKVSVEGLVTGVVPLSQAVERAFETLRDRPEYHLKMVVVPDSVLAQSGKSNVTGT
jgi:2-desacetyl-2-hydroxyethyl bacteriochlorophyllide A dehydrogenase